MGFRFFNPIYKTHLLFKLSTSSSSLHTPTKSLTLHINSLLQTSLYNTPHLTIHKRLHFGHSHHHHDEPSGGIEAEQVFRLGFASDIALASGKALTGYLSGSTAIIADAAHSISDVVLSGVAWWSYRVARAPKDKEHPYGHGKFETLGALGISGMLLATSGGIAWHAVDVLQGLLASNPDISILHGHHGHNGGHHHGIDMEHPILALNMTIVSIAVKEGLYWITKRAGEKSGSELMKANAWHHRADAVSSVVALIGVGGSILGVKFLDPLAGLVVSGMILKAGIESGYQSAMELVDAGVPLPLLEPMRQTILQVEGVMVYSVEDKGELEKFVASPSVSYHYYIPTAVCTSKNKCCEKLGEIKNKFIASVGIDDINIRKLLQKLHDNLMFCLENLGIWGAVEIKALHQYDCLRANKSTWGLEARVPFLDKEFINVAMDIDPEWKMIKPDQGRIEKWILRRAFDDEEQPYLPKNILYRQKEQFSDGVGYSWIDGLKAHAADRLPSVGINPQFITFTHVTMESEKYMCVGENSVVIIDMNMPMQPLRRPITADSALMNPNSRILALQVDGTMSEIGKLEEKQITCS